MEKDAAEKDSDGSLFSRKPRRERKEEIPSESKSQSTKENQDITTGKTKRVRNTGESKADTGGGWMDIKQDNSSKPISEPKPEIEEDNMPRTQNKDKHFDENNDEILIIPDLEEDGTEGDQRVSHAPRNFNRKIPTLEELETDVKLALPTSEIGLDMSVMLKTLVPATHLQEEDIPWNFDTLLREITEELLAPVITDLSKKTVDITDKSSNKLDRRKPHKRN